MKKINIINLRGDVVGHINTDAFSVDINKDLISAVVRYGALNQRTASAQTKNRSRVSGSGRKMYQQKRTGRARMGERNAVHHRGGSIAFGPNGRKYDISMNKKIRQKALAMVLLDKINNEKLYVVQEFAMSSYKTKDMKAMLQNLKLPTKCLFVDTNERVKSLSEIKEKNEFINFGLGLRNLPHCSIKSVDTMYLSGIIHSNSILISEVAIKQMIERLGGSCE